MLRPPKVSIIGAGNVGSHLAQNLHSAGVHVVEIYSRNIFFANALSGAVKARPVDRLDSLSLEADIFLVAVKDDALAELSTVSHLRLPGKIVAHTSGSQPASVLSEVSENHGVFWPIQTMTRGVKFNFAEVPIIITGSNSITNELLQNIAQRLSRLVFIMDDEKRMKLHAAAVFANNFTNRIIGIAKEILDSEDLPLEILMPIIKETIRKIEMSDPVKVQTGPAARNDDKTIEKHLSLLSHNKDWRNVYELLTESIKESRKELQHLKN